MSDVDVIATAAGATETATWKKPQENSSDFFETPTHTWNTEKKKSEENNCEI